MLKQSIGWFLRLLRILLYLFKYPGYGSLWNPGRGWIPLIASRHNTTWFLMMASRSSETPYRYLNSEEELRSAAVDRFLAHLKEDSPHTCRRYEADIRQMAKYIDLSIDMHLINQMEHALSKMHRGLCAMLFTVPSCSSLIFDTMPSTEITGILSELNQHILQCAEPQDESDNDSINELAGYASRGPVVLPQMCNQLQFVFSINMSLQLSFINRLMREFNQNMKRIERLRRGSKQLDPEGFWKGSSRAYDDYMMAAAKQQGDQLRAKFLKEAELQPLRVMRMIDCRATCEERRVVLRDWKDSLQAMGYSAISHTYGQDVYDVFNCRCASICAAEVPRCSFEPCPHDPAASNAANTRQNEIMGDILNMCAILKAAEVDYAWHDGVCIAQHDEAEVTETVEHMGWIYSNARETIIFLHYVGKPMAPIRPNNGEDDIICRWHTRVWTLQEAALSRCRRYCIRVGTNPIEDCESLEDFEMKVAQWYNDDFSKIEVIEEERFFEILKSIIFVMHSHRHVPEDSHITIWADCILDLLHTLIFVCFGFPDIGSAIQLCSRRESKHRGDRINSILTLAKVKGFVAPKDSNNMEASTIEFFERQGQKGLAIAVFSVNEIQPFEGEEGQYYRHTWLPVLSMPLQSFYRDGRESAGMRFEVRRDGKMQVRGNTNLLCVAVRFVVKPNMPFEELKSVDDDELKDVVDGLIKARQDIKAQHLLIMDLFINYIILQCTLSEGTTSFIVRRSPSHVSIPITGDNILPALRIDHRGQHQLLQHGESFVDVHLVLPAFDRAAAAGVPLLVVQGNLQVGEVSKVGVFVPNDLFLECVSKLLEYDCPSIFGCLESLVIT